MHMSDLLKWHSRQISHIYAVVQEKGEASAADMASRVGKSPRTIHRHCQRLASYYLLENVPDPTADGPYHIYTPGPMSAFISPQQLEDLLLLGPREWDVLSHVPSDTAATTINLLSQFSLTRLSLWTELQHLVQKGYVTEHTAATSNSPWQYSVTDTGKALLEEAGSTDIASLATLLEPFLAESNHSLDHIAAYLFSLDHYAPRSLIELSRLHEEHTTTISQRLRRCSEAGLVSAKKTPTTYTYMLSEQGERTITFWEDKISLPPRALWLECLYTELAAIETEQSLPDPYRGLIDGRVVSEDTHVSRYDQEKAAEYMTAADTIDRQYCVRLGQLLATTAYDRIDEIVPDEALLQLHTFLTNHKSVSAATKPL